jgi:hypothetical protein
MTLTITATVLQTPTTIEGTLVYDDPDGSMTTQIFTIPAAPDLTTGEIAEALVSPAVAFYQFVTGHPDRNLHGWSIAFASDHNPVWVIDFDFDS